jgi:hypothetical protein
MEMGRQTAPPKLRRGVPTIASDQRFLHFPNPWQQLMHSLPMLQHLHWVLVTLEHIANQGQLQPLAGLLNDNDCLCCWQAFGLREVLDGAVVWP